MTFAQPAFLYGLLLVPLAALFLIWAERRRKADLARLGNPLFCMACCLCRWPLCS